MIDSREDISMSKRLISMMIITTASMWAFTGCADGSDKTSEETTTTEPVSESAQPSTTAKTIDWSIMESGESPADLADYDYPFALDSQNVRDYAEYFDVDSATAQHNLTVSMASNEALSKVLDQVSDSYTSHELTDGKDMKLIIHTLPDVSASSYDYVLSDNFAKGLVLPIEIKPDGVQDEVEKDDEL